MKGRFKRYISTGVVNFWQLFDYKIENGITYIKNANNAFDVWRKGEIPADSVLIKLR